MWSLPKEGSIGDENIGRFEEGRDKNAHNSHDDLYASVGSEAPIMTAMGGGGYFPLFTFAFFSTLGGNSPPFFFFFLGNAGKSEAAGLCPSHHLILHHGRIASPARKPVSM